MVDDDVRTELEALTDLAPLHQPKSFAALDAVTELAPDVPAVACFDTAFHATLSPAAATYAVPAEWRDRLHVRRYGFHGLSHAYAARRATAGLGGAGRVVTCHLGAGASLAAVRGGRCVDTTMGFTPLEGLVMATRSGTVDPGALLWLITHHGVDPGAMAHTLEHESGLLALAGTSDMAAVVEACRGASRRPSSPSTSTFTGCGRRSQRWLPAWTVSTPWCSPAASARTPRRSGRRRWRGWGSSGWHWTPDRNDEAVGGAADPEADITAAGSAVRALVVAAREDLEIAQGVRARLR